MDSITPTSSTITDLSEYLKKSELPKNVSSFNNDVNYISASALEDWMKEHSYITKSEIESLITKAKMEIVNGNNQTDEYSIQVLEELVDLMRGEVDELKDMLKSNSADIEDMKDKYIPAEKESTFASKSDLDRVSETVTNIARLIPETNGFATESWVEGQGYLKAHQDISGKADKSYVDEKIAELAASIPSIPESPETPESPDSPSTPSVPAQSLEGYATEAWVEEQGYFRTHQDISGKADKSYVDEKIAEAKAEIPSLAGYATEEWVGEQGYFRVHQDISGKADKSYVDQKVSEAKTAIPSLDGYATEEWVKNQKYVTSASMSSTLSKYAKASTTYDKRYIDSTFIDIHEIQDYAKKEDIESTYLPKKDIASTYITKRDASNTYLTKEDYRGLKSAATISDAYANKTYKDILADLDKGLTLLDGFYVTKDDDGNITYMLIKNNELQVYQGGNVTVRPEWEEED